MIIGIDLGTTNSAAGVWRDGKVELIPNSLGAVLTPSAVGLDDDGALLVGLAARERRSTHPQLTATTFKRYMGTTRATQLGRQSYQPEELSALVLARLKADAEAYLGEPVTEAVITVPAYFNDKQRKATRRAGELAGLKVERLLNEPTAAALAYGIHELADETRFLVFDLGGGTFDVSVLEIFEGVIEVRASTGDNRLGGEDFNRLLVDRLRAAHREALGADAMNEALTTRLEAAAEKARRALTQAERAEMAVTWKDRTHTIEITTEDFEAAAAPLLAKLKEPVSRALRDGGLGPNDLKEIILVGGATRMPLVRRTVTRMFGRFPSTAVHPDEAVVAGAAIQAGLKSRDAALKDVVMTDVCPYSLGVDVAEPGPMGSMRTGIFSPVIERNTVVPASRAKIFGTLQNNQRKVIFGIYQGEARMVADNVRLGEVEIPVPPGKAGEVAVECRFSYDVNGLIEIDVLVPQTNERRQLVIVDEDDQRSSDLEQRRAALAALKVHPRDTDANRAAIARAQRCYELFLGETREHVGALLSQFEGVLEGQDPRQIEIARQQLLTALDALEGESFL
ncbi:Hsp70 family protein [Caulobacter hibisci]|uniref:Molecular chaperone HscC n=1 Tax=Caulobacter hibisci TaxID=2035993 RepID=A0ABS0SSH9_9CAUL|nr:molecular chaperone HscC [Caulobacter hibisci]